MFPHLSAMPPHNPKGNTMTSTVLMTVNMNTNSRSRAEHGLWLEAQAQRAEGYSEPGLERVGPRITSAWNVQARHQVHIGDVALLLAQGPAPHGIIADGVVVREPFKARKWREDATRPEQWYVLVEWFNVVLLDNPLPTEVLKEQLPEVNWHTQCSGLVLENTYSPEAAVAVRELWAERLAEGPVGVAAS
jgi:hypothetical protein